MNKCMNQDPDTGSYCGKTNGHAGAHMNMHTLLQWMSLDVHAEERES